MGLLSRRPSGAYSGRLAFDPDTLFHTDPEGNPVVTDDGGKTWRYATSKDESHNKRYHGVFKVVNTTANAAEPEPHHFQPSPADPHYGSVQFLPDHEAETATGHTEAW